MGIIHEVKLPKENQNWFIAGDFHAESMDVPCFQILIKHLLNFPQKQRNLIINGDFLDTSYFMPKNPEFQHWKDRKDGVDEFFLPEFEREIKWANGTLDTFQNICNIIIFINGNHDSPRIDLFREKFCPAGFKEHFNLEKQLRLHERHIGNIGYNEWLDFGQLSITHGMYHGTTCHKKHYEACGARNVVFNHVHSAECKTFTIRGESRSAWSLPAMCKLNPDYIKGGETNWQNGYGQFLIRPDGRFNFSTHLIFNDKLVLPDMTVLIP